MHLRKFPPQDTRAVRLLTGGGKCFSCRKSYFYTIRNSTRNRSISAILHFLNQSRNFSKHFILALSEKNIFISKQFHLKLISSHAHWCCLKQCRSFIYQEIFKNTNYFVGGQKMGLQAFSFRSTHTKCLPLVKKKQRKAKKISGRVAIQSVAIPPVLLLKTELQSRKPDP